MSEYVHQLEFRLADTRVAGTRIASTEEARQAGAEIEAALKAENQQAIAGDAEVSVLRWKDTQMLSTLSLQVSVRADAIDLGRATELTMAVMRRVQQGAFRSPPLASAAPGSGDDR